MCTAIVIRSDVQYVSQDGDVWATEPEDVAARKKDTVKATYEAPKRTKLMTQRDDWAITSEVLANLHTLIEREIDKGNTVQSVLENLVA
jgi:hypothetical protein